MRCVDCYRVHAAALQAATDTPANFNQATKGAQTVALVSPETNAIIRPMSETNEACLKCHPTERAQLSMPYSNAGPEFVPPSGPTPLLVAIGNYYINPTSTSQANTDSLRLNSTASPNLIFNGSVSYMRLTNKNRRVGPIPSPKSQNNGFKHRCRRFWPDEHT